MASDKGNAVNRYRGEVPFRRGAEGAFLRFSLQDLAELEDTFGRDFFATVEEAALYASPRDLPKVLAIGLKRRDGDGNAVRIWDEIETDPLPFQLSEAGQPILEAIAQAHLGKSYEDLIKEAEEARKKQATEAIKQAKEAAEQAGAPFEASEALLNAVLALQTGSASTPTQSGD